ncbi:calcium/sodium antiporter [Patescibacteria group bacterium]|nr:calcium/sodium antiporter [Patescibacteria group bacterium]
MLTYILFIIGLIILVKGADHLVDGATSLAKKWHVPNIVIGLTIISFGTSLPELIVNILAASSGSTDIGIGTVIGSNISNIALVLGLAAIIYPIAVRKSTQAREIPYSILSALILLVIVSDKFFNAGTESFISRVDGIIMLIFFGLFLIYNLNISLKHRKLDLDKELLTKRNYRTIFILLISGLVGLYFGGKWVVEGAVAIANLFNLSEFVISATIIAIGTSLPELATTMAAAYRKNLDMAVGNIVGSNIFNILLVLGITAVIQPMAAPLLIGVDVIYLIGLSVILFAFLIIGKKYELERWQGASLLIIYFGYIAFIIIRG